MGDELSSGVLWGVMINAVLTLGIAALLCQPKVKAIIPTEFGGSLKQDYEPVYKDPDTGKPYTQKELDDIVGLGKVTQGKSSRARRLY